MGIKTRAKIDLKLGIIELSGSEEFVSKYLEEYKEKIFFNEKSDMDDELKKNYESKEEEKVSHPEKAKKKTPKNGKGKSSSSIKPEEFDMDAKDGQPSLKEFYNLKNPNETVANRIAVIGYYITKIKKQEYFTEGNIDFAYIALGLTKRPIHLHQQCINARNNNHFLVGVNDKDNAWNLNRIGEIFVEEKLPPSVSKTT